MLMASAYLPSVLAVASGVSVHLTVFRRGEWDVAAPSVFAVYFMTFAAALSLSCVSWFQISPWIVAKVAACHVAGLYASMLVYRGFFHRLSKFPGPVLARLTTFYITARSMKKLHLYAEVQQLHAQYGDYVRLGDYLPYLDLCCRAMTDLILPAPNELSIADPGAVKAIYGSQSPTTKGSWYTLLEPRVPLFMARDKQEHARRCKVWD